MARAPMVTRTFKTTEAEIMCLNVTNGNSFYKTITLPRTYKDEKEILKNAKKIIDNDNEKAVHVVYTNIVEQLYGMTEQKFIENADILPPRIKGETEINN